MSSFISVPAFRCLVCVGACSALACESISEKITEKAVEVAVEKTIENKTGAKVDIDTSQQGIRIQSNDGTHQELVFNGQGGKVPDNWPKDIPAYPGAKVNASMTSGKGGMLLLETGDSPEKVLAFYKSKLAHMKETATMNAGGTSLVTYEDQSAARQLAVGASTKDGKTMVHLQLSDKGK